MSVVILALIGVIVIMMALATNWYQENYMRSSNEFFNIKNSLGQIEDHGALQAYKEACREAVNTASSKYDISILDDFIKLSYREKQGKMTYNVLTQNGEYIEFEINAISNSEEFLSLYIGQNYELKYKSTSEILDENWSVSSFDYNEKRGEIVIKERIE